MPRCLFPVLFCCLLSSSLFAQQTTAQDPRVWLEKIQQNRTDTIQVRWLLELSNYYLLIPGRQQPQSDSCLLFASKADVLAAKLNDPNGQAKACIILSRLYKVADPEKARDYEEQAIRLFTGAKSFTDLGYGLYEISNDYNPWTSESAEKIKLIARSVDAFHTAGNLKKEADAIKELADVRQITGDYLQSLAELKQALAIYLSINEPKLHGIYDLMGDVSSSLGNLDDAVKYGLLAEQAAAKAGDSSLQLCTIYNHLGNTYYYLQDNNSSASYYRKALAIAEKYTSYNNIFLISSNYGNILFRMGKYAECNRHLHSILAKYHGIDTTELIHYVCSFVSNYTALRQFPQAEKYFRQLLAITKDRFINVETQNSVYTSIIRYLLASGQYAKARYYLEMEEKYHLKSNTPIQLAGNQLSWITLDSALGDQQSAFRHFRTYIGLKDSIYNEEKQKYIAQLGVQYETEKKDRKLQLKEKNIQLLEQYAKLQSGRLTQARQARNWILGASLLFIIIIGLLVNYSRLKQKTNRKLRAQQEEIEKNNEALQRLVQEKEWLVKEIHHRVKNNFHIVQGLLGTQSGYLKSEEAINALADSQHRVQAMALIHQRLYQSDNLSAINMVAYIHELVNYLRDSFKIRPTIQFHLEIDSVELGLTHCIPLGLILNEAITNSIKYAFPGESPGTIRISLKRVSGNQMSLHIRDNGIGLPGNFEIQHPNSMGMRLIKGLSDDIEATLQVSGEHGTEIQLVFVHDVDQASHFKNKPELTHTT